jgi:hypothetical protein
VSETQAASTCPVPGTFDKRQGLARVGEVGPGFLDDHVIHECGLQGSYFSRRVTASSVVDNGAARRQYILQLAVQAPLSGPAPIARSRAQSVIMLLPPRESSER